MDRSILLVVLLILIGSACQSPDHDKLESQARNEILQLHNRQREMHFANDYTQFVDMFSDEFLSINRGFLRVPSREENLETFKGYFETVVFEKWDDLEPPMIRFSDDYTTAYTSVRKEVVIKYSFNDTDTLSERTEYAWLTVYRKIDGNWKIDAISSTNRESSIDTIR